MHFNSTKLSQGVNSSIMNARLWKGTDNVNDKLSCSHLTCATFRGRP